MKKAKILAIVALTLCALLAFAACNKAEPAPAQPAAAPASTEEVKNLVGIVADGGSMHDLYVEDSTGATYLFGIGDDTTVDSGATDIGSEVKVHYTGALESTDQMQEVEVKRVELMKAAPEAKPAPAPAPSSQAPLTGTDSNLPSGASKMMEATVDQINDDNTFYASDATGVDYHFSLEGLVIESADGSVHEGDTISIYYTGSIEATDQVQSKITISKIVVK